VSNGAVQVAHPSLATPVEIACRSSGAATAKVGDEVTLGVRPEHILLGEGPNRIDLKVDLSESLGGSTLIYGQTAAGEAVNLQAAGRRQLAKGESFTAGFATDHVYLFDGTGRAL
jgi:lactose/L-arabinose transport system ATP-binding protein